MQPQTYKVKKGDTLSGIAKNLGVNAADISGYRSGNKDLIYEGETLTYGQKPKETDSYASTVRSELSNDQPTATGPNIDTYRTEFDTYKKSRDDSYEKLKGVATSTFNTEYENRDLEKKKQRIETLDSDIASAKAARDEAINKARNNPGLSASQMTGDIAKIRDAQNATINNLISERNSVATEYNTGLDEIDGIIERATSDAQLDFSYWDGMLKEANSYISDYDKSIKEELQSTQEQQNFEKQLAQQLQIAMKNSGGGGSTSGGDWKLIYDDYGNPLYWFNASTREIDYNVGNSQGGGNEATVGGDGYDNIQVESGGGNSSEDKGGYFSNLWSALWGK